METWPGSDVLDSHMILYTKEQKIEVLKCLAERLGLTALDSASDSFSLCDCIALRDWIQTSNNGIERMKIAIEAIAPVLAGLLIPPQICLKMSREEKVGVVRSRVVKLDSVITRAGNRRDMHR